MRRLELRSSSLDFCASLDTFTPLSLDTAYSSMHQDTPSSAWQTPLSLGTPCTSPQSYGTPRTPPQLDLVPVTPHCLNQGDPLKSQDASCTPYSSRGASRTPQLSLQTLRLLGTPTSTHKDPCHPIRLITRAYPPPRALGADCGRGHRSRQWQGSHKYQDAYNRRPEHHYVQGPAPPAGLTSARL